MEKQLSQHAKDIAQSLATKHFDFTMRFDKQLVKAKYDVLAPLMKKDAEIEESDSALTEFSEGVISSEKEQELSL